jgi:hypothetical protein
MPKGEHNTSWERLDRKTVLNSKFMSVYVDTVKLPNGSIIDDYSVVSLPSGVIVVATDIEGRLIAQYEYKYAIDKTILNLPSGSVENGMSPVDVAKNELQVSIYFSFLRPCHRARRLCHFICVYFPSQICQLSLRPPARHYFSKHQSVLFH